MTDNIMSLGELESKFRAAVSDAIILCSTGFLDIKVLVKGISSVCGNYNFDVYNIENFNTYISCMKQNAGNFRAATILIKLITDAVVKPIVGIEIQERVRDDGENEEEEEEQEEEEENTSSINNDLSTKKTKKTKKYSFNSSKTLVIPNPIVNISKDVFGKKCYTELTEIISKKHFLMTEETKIKTSSHIKDRLLYNDILKEKSMGTSNRNLVQRRLKEQFNSLFQTEIIAIVNKVVILLQKERLNNVKKNLKKGQKKENLKIVIKSNILTSQNHRDKRMLGTIKDGLRSFGIIKKSLIQIKKGNLLFNESLELGISIFSHHIRNLLLENQISMDDIFQLDFFSLIGGWHLLMKNIFTDAPDLHTMRRNIVSSFFYFSLLIEDESERKLLRDDYVEEYEKVFEKVDVFDYLDGTGDLFDDYVSTENDLGEASLETLQKSQKGWKKNAVFIELEEGKVEDKTRSILCIVKDLSKSKDGYYVYFQCKKKKVFCCERLVDVILYSTLMYSCLDLKLRLRALMNYVMSCTLGIGMPTKDRKPVKVLDVMGIIRSRKDELEEYSSVLVGYNENFVLAYRNDGLKRPKSNTKQIDLSTKKLFSLYDDFEETILVRISMMTKNGTLTMVNQVVSSSISQITKVVTERFEFITTCGKVTGTYRGYLMEQLDTKVFEMIGEDAFDLMVTCIEQDISKKLGDFCRCQAVDTLAFAMYDKYPTTIKEYPPLSIFAPNVRHLISFGFFRDLHITPLLLFVDYNGSELDSFSVIQADSMKSLSPRAARNRARSGREKKGRKIVIDYLKKRSESENKSLKRKIKNKTYDVIIEVQGTNRCGVNTAVFCGRLKILVSHGQPIDEIDEIELREEEMEHFQKNVFDFVATGKAPRFFLPERLLTIPQYLSNSQVSSICGGNQMVDEDGNMPSGGAGKRDRSGEKKSNSPKKKKRRKK